jgi:hypothetical protein
MELVLRDCPCRPTSWQNRWHWGPRHHNGSSCRSATHTLSADFKLALGIICAPDAAHVHLHECQSCREARRPDRRHCRVANLDDVYVPPLPPPRHRLKATRRPRRAEGCPLRATRAFKRSSPPGSEAGPSTRAALACITFFAYGASQPSSSATRASWYAPCIGGCRGRGR